MVSESDKGLGRNREGVLNELKTPPRELKSLKSLKSLKALQGSWTELKRGGL